MGWEVNNMGQDGGLLKRARLKHEFSEGGKILKMIVLVIENLLSVQL